MSEMYPELASLRASLEAGWARRNGLNLTPDLLAAFGMA